GEATVLARGAILEVELKVVIGLAADDDRVLGEAELFARLSLALDGDVKHGACARVSSGALALAGAIAHTRGAQTRRRWLWYVSARRWQRMSRAVRACWRRRWPRAAGRCATRCWRRWRPRARGCRRSRRSGACSP